MLFYLFIEHNKINYSGKKIFHHVLI